jgi:hypothetical protein
MLNRRLVMGPIAGAALVAAGLTWWRPDPDQLVIIAQGKPTAASPIVTSAQTQVFAIQLPETAADGQPWQLVVQASAYQPPKAGAAGYIVKLRANAQSAETEVGRFAIFPVKAH